MTKRNTSILERFNGIRLSEKQVSKGKLTLTRGFQKYHLTWRRSTWEKPTILATITKVDMEALDRIFEPNISKRVKNAILRVIKYDHKLLSFYPGLNETKGRKKGEWNLVSGNPEYTDDVPY